MEKDFILGRMVAATKENIKMIKSTGMEFILGSSPIRIMIFLGLMGGSTKEIGNMANSMGKANTLC